MIIWQRPNLLLLDEPTNHLDLDMRRALTEALIEFEGAIVVVSHDRHLLRSTTDDLYLVHDGQVEPFDGDLDDYQRWLADSQKQMRQSAEPAAENGEEKIPSPRRIAKSRNAVKRNSASRLSRCAKNRRNWKNHEPVIGCYCCD